MSRRLALILLIVYFVFPTCGAKGSVDYRAIGDDHYFNLEYDEAITAYRRLLENDPDDLVGYNRLATAILFKELLRLGKLESSAFKGDNQFLREKKPEPDPEAIEHFKEVLFKGRDLAKQALKENPEDAMARFALSNSFGLQANYQFMIEKAYFGALRNGVKARKHGVEILDHDRYFIDAYLVLGVYEYVVGSLPWAVRVLVAIGGISGDKEKGEEYVRLVAERGKYARNEARSLLALLLRREKRPLEAAEVIRGLMSDFPRNYVLHLELGAMYQDAGKNEQALTTFRTAQEKVVHNEDRFGRMPQRAVDALERKIEKLQEEIQQTKDAA